MKIIVGRQKNGGRKEYTGKERASKKKGKKKTDIPQRGKSHIRINKNEEMNERIKSKVNVKIVRGKRAVCI